MDAQVIMSATANPKVGNGIAGLGYWAAIAVSGDSSHILSLVTQAMERPQFSLKSSVREKAELRFQLGDKLGLAGFVDQGEVEIAFPFVRGGHRYEMEVIHVVEAPSGLERWITADFSGCEVTFFDALHTIGGTSCAAGETHPFFLNALAISLKRVQSCSDALLCDGELPFPATGYPTFLSSVRKEPDEFVFQCAIDGEPRSSKFDDRKFAVLPISLRDDEETLIDLYVAPEIIETLGSPLSTGEEIAGVIWLQGYSPALFEPSRKKKGAIAR